MLTPRHLLALAAICLLLAPGVPAFSAGAAGQAYEFTPDGRPLGYRCRIKGVLLHAHTARDCERAGGVVEKREVHDTVRTVKTAPRTGKKGGVLGQSATPGTKSQAAPAPATIPANPETMLPAPDSAAPTQP
ncbi:MAG: hypothetical protein KQJ78_09940 [Deltaproteobacteria bacterium]|nr:hypothetical protein [Deltaproteobacteria bacterium]